MDLIRDGQEIAKDRAIAMASTGWWEGVPDIDVVRFQLFQRCLCMDFSDFYGAVERVLGRPVYTHEFAKPELLRDEFLGGRERPTFQEILDQIPEEKRAVIMNA